MPKIKKEKGQNLIKSRKLFFQFSKFLKINCRENVLEDKNAKINTREQKLIYSNLETTCKKRKKDDHEKTSYQSHFKDIKEYIKQFHSSIAVGPLFV